MSWLTEMFHTNEPKCKNCGETWYAHHDHSHVTNCPFGDCGNYTRPT